MIAGDDASLREEVAEALLLRLLSVQESGEQAETLLSSVLVAVDQAVMIADPTFVLTGWNRKAEELYGWTAAEAVGHRQWRLLGAADLPREGTTEETHWDREGRALFVEGSVVKLTGAYGEVVGYVSLFRDAAERLRLEQAALHAGDRERRRIGQDLHDGISQMLAGIAFLSGRLEESLQSQERSEAATAGRINELVREVIGHVKDLSRRLYPVDVETRGLQPALLRLAATTSRTYGIRCTFSDETLEFPVLTAATATHLFRIAQEALGNAVRHGSAGEIRISMSREGLTGTMRIEDDGVEPLTAARSAGGMGIESMRERARAIHGTLQLRRAGSTGRVVQCRFPIEDPTAPSARREG